MTQGVTDRRERESDAARLLLAAARERFSAAATDLLLPEKARLTEYQRLTASTLLSRLVRSIEDDLRRRIAERFRTNETLHAALSSAEVAITYPILERAHVLRDAELSTILVRRVEEHRFWQTHSPTAGGRFLLRLVQDDDSDVSAAAMGLVIARSRRFDRFQEPVLGKIDLPAELQHRLVWLVAAALRHYIVQHYQAGDVDAALTQAVSSSLGDHDESESFEATAYRLVRRLRDLGRLDGKALADMIGEGLLTLFIAGVALLCRMDQVAAWEVVSDPRGRGPALLLRAADVDREAAAAIFLALTSHGPALSPPEGDAAAAQLDVYDSLDREQARQALLLWQAPPTYRAAVTRLSTRNRSASEAA